MDMYNDRDAIKTVEKGGFNFQLLIPSPLSVSDLKTVSSLT